MESTANIRAAKEFLIHCIVDEARREGVALSDTERDMLYFTETAWTLPNMLAISDAFDRSYDQGAYETKVAALIRAFKARTAKEDRAALEMWNNSVRALASEDHYILVMIGIAGGNLKPTGSDYETQPNRMLKLRAIGPIAGIAALLITFAILFIARR